jgi:hypothetical protein
LPLSALGPGLPLFGGADGTAVGIALALVLVPFNLLLQRIPGCVHVAGTGSGIGRLPKALQLVDTGPATGILVNPRLDFVPLRGRALSCKITHEAVPLGIRKHNFRSFLAGKFTPITQRRATTLTAVRSRIVTNT